MVTTTAFHWSAPAGSAGLERDFDLCLAFDSLDVVPLLDGDGFVAAKD